MWQTRRRAGRGDFFGWACMLLLELYLSNCHVKFNALERKSK